MPKDAQGASIQILAPGTSIVLSPNASSVSAAFPAGAKVLYIAATGDVWVKFGVGSATAAASAGSFFIPGGVAFFAVPSISGAQATFIAAYGAAAQTVCVGSLE
jgi:hypothetical protein